MDLKATKHFNINICQLLSMNAEFKLDLRNMSILDELSLYYHSIIMISELRYKGKGFTQ